MASIKKTVTSVGEDLEKLEPLCVAPGKVQWHSPRWRRVWQITEKFNTESPDGPEIPLLGVCPRKVKTHVPIKTRTCVFAALFVIVKAETT